MILAIDPSGNFTEGKGTTGYVLVSDDDFKILGGDIKAKDFDTREAYWNKHIEIIKFFKPKIVVIEDYRLYGSKINNQINSQVETCRLIGIIQWYCWKNNIPVHLQLASEVKNRWTDEIIEKEGFKMHFSSRHMKDAFRHALHYYTFKNKPKPKKKPPKGVNGNERSNY